MEIEKLIKLLSSGQVGVMPTDTIYGIVGLALNPKVVEKIYKLRKRSKDKPMIILISSLDDLNKFNIRLTKPQKDFLENNWPNPVSVVLPCNSEEFNYLHRGKNTLAFRMPKDEKLLKLLEETGPLVAPSANIEGGKPAENIEEAKKYFGNNVEFYLEGGIINNTPSTLVDFTVDEPSILRQGEFKIY